MRSYVYHRSLCKTGEEVCGDSVKYTASDENVFFVLSDGLGSGIKANIFSNLTVGIMLTMAAADMPIGEIVRTVSRTLPIDPERGMAYSTFTVVNVQPSGLSTFIVYDNPDPIILRNGALFMPDYEEKVVQDKILHKAVVQLSQGDTIFLISDGVTYAGLGMSLRFGWGWENAAAFVEETQRATQSVEKTVDMLIDKVDRLYGGRPGDDATVLGAIVRSLRRTVVLTGPPMDPADDAQVVSEFLQTPGEKVVCGGTTTNIISRETGRVAEVDVSTARPDCPPMGSMPGADLVTEGVLTISKAIQLVRQANGDERNIPHDRNGATELARTMLGSDHVKFIVGLRVDPLYQNPLLPLSISLRKYLIEELAGLLRTAGKSVDIDYH
ncbi:MAG TPA: PP2C family protein-serine/threonine phosphatase [Clostridia bacterium]|nr:PP2C family protein-serine/threonine phosphatase [Clostridia bacterium]